MLRCHREDNIDSLHNAVADPGFLRGLHQPIIWQNFAENCMKMNLTGASLGSTTALSTSILDLMYYISPGILLFLLTKLSNIFFTDIQY